MLPKTIDAALLNLRAQIVRDGGEGLEHVEALLALRGCALPRVVPKAPPRWFQRRERGRLILAELRGGPVRSRANVAAVSARRPELVPDEARRSVHAALAKLRAKGLVRHRGWAWWVPS